MDCSQARASYPPFRSQLTFENAVTARKRELTVDLIRLLNELPWSPDNWPTLHQQTELLLAKQWLDRENLFRQLRHQLRDVNPPIVTRTAELHSWLLYTGTEYCLKLNQFIPSPATGRNSENVHDHSRPLTTLTLGGGYKQNYFNPEGSFQPGHRFSLEEFMQAPGPSTAPGHVYSITPEVFHALNGFEDQTMTLVVYGPIVKDHITVFNTVTGVVEHRKTYASAQAELLDNLRRLAA